MQGKPSFSDLHSEVHQFLWANRRWGWMYIKPLILPIIPLIFSMTVADYYLDDRYDQVLLLSNIGLFYFLWLSSFSWYRAFLLGPRNDWVVHPFRLKKNEGWFIGRAILLWFAILSLLLILLMALTSALILTFLAIVDGVSYSVVEIIVTVLAYIVSCAAVYFLNKLIAYIFRFPAKSINQDISYNLAKALSRGCVRYLVLFWLFTYWFILPVVGMINDAFDHVLGLFIDESSLVFALISLCIKGGPFILCLFYVTALNAGVLSRLYQWAVQERG